MKYDRTKLQKVTIYTQSMMGVNKIQAHLIEHGKMDYAQYKDVPFVKYIRPRKQKVEGYLKGYKPFILIVDGWDTPDPDDGFTEPKESETGLIVRQSKYSAYEGGYRTDFNEMIAKENVKIIADYRSEK